jgi:hypothetical protein
LELHAWSWAVGDDQDGGTVAVGHQYASAAEGAARHSLSPSIFLARESNQGIANQHRRWRPAQRLDVSSDVFAGDEVLLVLLARFLAPLPRKHLILITFSVPASQGLGSLRGCGPFLGNLNNDSHHSELP